MDLKNVDLLKLQTQYMQQDKTTQGLCAALTPQFQELAEEVRLALIYARISELDEPLLDELAWQFRVDWYDSEADISVKRNIIKKAIIVHKTIGTAYAVEQVLSTVFEYAVIQEWWEYGGEPYHFRVATDENFASQEEYDNWLKALNRAKRVSTIFDGVQRWIMNTDNLPEVGINYVWVDGAIWHDENIWKDGGV